MANTYFKYAERNAENRINWAEVGKDMTDMLADEVRVRGEKKAAIDADFREFGKALSEAPMGEHGGRNELITDFASNASEYSLMINNLLKSGDLKLRDYNNVSANLREGTEEAFSLTKEFNTAFKLFQERSEINSETGLPFNQDLEEFVLGNAQGFGNYSNHRLWINPTTGRLSLGSTETDDDGNVTLSRDTGTFVPVNSLRNRIRTQYDMYDMDTASAGMVDKLKELIVVKKKDGVLTVSDPTADEDVQDALELHAQSVVAIATNVSSILTNTVNVNPNSETGESFSFTYVPSEAAENENLILLINNPLQESAGIPMPAFLDSEEALATYLRENYGSKSAIDATSENYVSDKEIKLIVANNTKQIKVAKDTVKTSLLSKIDYKETPTPMYDPFRGSYTNYKERNQLEDNAVGLWSEAYSLPADKRQIVLDAMVSAQESLKNGLVELSIDGDQIIYRYKNDDKTHTIQIGSDNPTRKEWVRLGAEFHGVSDVDRMTDYAGNFTKDDDGEFKPYIPSSRLVSAKREAIGEDPDEIVKSYIVSSITADLISGNEDADLEKLQPIAVSLGYEVSTATDGYNIVTLKVPGADGAKLEITPDTPAKTIQNWMIQNMNDTRKEKYLKTRTAPIEEGETAAEKAARVGVEPAVTTGSGSLDDI
jgi:hypothetical protein